MTGTLISFLGRNTAKPRVRRAAEMTAYTRGKTKSGSTRAMASKS